MANEWNTVRLSEVYEIRSGLSKPRSEFGFGYGFLTFKDVLDNYFVPNALAALVNSTEQERSLCSVRRGDVFLTRTSETQEDLGMSCVALKDYESATFNGFTKRLRPKPGAPNVIPEYAAYYFRGPRFRRAVTAMSSLSTRASLNNEMLERLTIVLPPVDVQAAIGKVLKTLDDKIELNRRMNESLEAMARAIFKSWFVDFDPVRAKMDGCKPLGMDAATAALFPDSFRESELGHIPAGWTIGTLGEICDFVRRTVQPNQFAADIPYIGLEHMPRRSITLAEWGHAGDVDSAKAKFERGEILFGKLRPYFHKVGLAPFDGVCSTDILTIAPKENGWLGFALFHLSSDEVIDHADACSTGTKMPRVNAQDLARYEIAIPPAKLAARFDAITRPVLERCIIHTTESRTLAAIRDALLPKLLSGQIVVGDAAQPETGEGEYLA